MQRIVKYCAMSFGVVLLLIFAIFGFVAATFNPNDYKDVAIKLVKDKKQRTMTIPGTISLKFFPSIGAHLGKVTLSDCAEIAKIKMVDLNANDLEAATKIICGSAESMGLEVVKN